MYNNGIKINLIKEKLGHKSIFTTLEYITVDEKELAEVPHM